MPDTLAFNMVAAGTAPATGKARWKNAFHLAE
jgi:hypothetical protein